MSNTAYPQPTKLDYPEEQQKHAWLAFAFEAFYRADIGVSESIRVEEEKGRELACAKGCATCCASHTTIPIFPLELLTIYWYVTENLDPAMRPKLKSRLQQHDADNGCPFLVESACAIHPVRPLACRHFNVFGKQCAEGEDAYFTRRDDVLIPIQTHQNAALKAMLPFHGFVTEAQQQQAMQASYLQNQAKVLQQIDWGNLAARI